MRLNPRWSDTERNLFIIELNAEACRVCDTRQPPGHIRCCMCGNAFRSDSADICWTYGWEEIEEMRRQYAISVVEELLDGST